MTAPATLTRPPGPAPAARQPISCHCLARYSITR